MRKAVDANRRNKGDHWIAWGTAYGPGGTVYFISPRASFADVEKASADFDRALKESLGPAAAKLGFDFDSCVERSRSEIRIFRWDLSRNAPEDSQEIMRHGRQHPLGAHLQRRSASCQSGGVGIRRSRVPQCHGARHPQT